MQEDILKIKSLIEKLTKDNRDECTIMTGGTPDESMIIGTKLAYLNVCKGILDILCSIDSKESPSSDLDIDEIAGVQYYFSNKIKYYFNELGEVWPIVLGICENNNQVLQISKALKLQ